MTEFLTISLISHFFNQHFKHFKVIRVASIRIKDVAGQLRVHSRLAVLSPSTPALLHRSSKKEAMADVASSASSSAAEKTISLKTNDDRVFALPRKAIAVSGTINTMLRDLGGDDESDFSSEIPLPNVSGSIFEKIEEWCRHHKDDAPYVHIDPREQRTEDISPWDQDFLNVEQSTLFEILQAANYLDMKPLLDTCCKTLANIMKGKSTQELRDIFHIENDFSPEEEEQIRRENAWCED